MQTDMCMETCAWRHVHGDSFRLSHLCGGDSTSLGSDEQVACKAIARAVPLAVVACGRGLRSWLAVVACGRGVQSWLAEIFAVLLQLVT